MEVLDIGKQHGRQTLGILAGLLLVNLLIPGWALAQGAGAAPVEDSQQVLMNVMVQGGPIMWILGVLSVVALFLIVFYAVTIREGRFIQREFVRKVYDLVNQGHFGDAQSLCEKVDGILPRVMAAGLRRREMGMLAVSEGMASVGSREIERFRQRIRYLSDIAAIAPMLGLLGTVLGMIEAFVVVAAKQEALINPTDLAGAVSFALVTTAAGLIVAIPASAAYYFFRGRLVRVAARVEEQATEFAERIIGVKTGRIGR